MRVKEEQLDDSVYLSDSSLTSASHQLGPSATNDQHQLQLMDDLLATAGVLVSLPSVCECAESR